MNDKLQRIRARCVELLALADSCAGAAEAGWRSTIAAIDVRNRAAIETIMGDTESEAASVINAILAAWPEELL